MRNPAAAPVNKPCSSNRPSARLAAHHPSTKHNQLLIQPLPEDITVHINGTDLIQILLNLTLNALQCGSNYHRVEILCQFLDHPLDLTHFQDGPHGPRRGPP